MEAHPASGSWEEFRHVVRGRVTPVTWRTWLEALTIEESTEGSLRIGAPSEFHLRWINERYRDLLDEVAALVYGADISVDLVAVPQAIFIDDDPDPEPLEPTAPVAPTHDDPERLQPKYSFENFVVGPSNRFAHAAALAIAEQPGGTYNPLFVWGGAGLGKTHLLHALAHHAIDLNPRLRVCYVTSEAFFNAFVDGIRKKRMDQFKATYRTIDLLLLDDVQFLEGKEGVLEEFFHTFNALYEDEKQLVFSADRPPKSLTSLEDRIRTRFEWGLMTDIQPPDVETRLAILRRNATFAPQEVPEAVLEFIATRVIDNIRELEGALTRVTAWAALTNERIDLEMAEDVLQDLRPHEGSVPISPGRILAATAEAFGVSITDLEGPSRRQPLARARQVAMYVCRTLTDLSLPKIGHLFGNRDHTTVLHGVNQVNKLMKEDPVLFDRVTALLQGLKTS